MTDKNKLVEFSVGARFNRLVVTGEVGNKLICRCDCGNKTHVQLSNLLNENTKSCGCLSIDKLRQRSTTHGMSNTPEYGAWSRMKSRCLNLNDPSYVKYGGAGITVCEKWVDDFEAFFSDVGARPTEKHSLDRIDGTKGYAEGNVRWATPKQQARNRGMWDNNTSGAKGVHWSNKAHRIGKNSTKYAIAQWRDMNGRLNNKCFSAKKYGEELAFFLACEYREYQMLLLNLQGAGYTRGHVYD